jgi:hypothetical protein
MYKYRIYTLHVQLYVASVSPGFVGIVPYRNLASAITAAVT